ncbi:MAG: right-handed parallel beta-helix repeat-containing protein [Bellilinea sp.]
MNQKLTVIIILTTISAFFSQVLLGNHAWGTDPSIFQQRSVHSASVEPHTIYLPIIQTTDGAFFVSMTGSDGNPGTASAPWKTLQYAVNHAPAGSVIYIRAGEYTGFTLTRSDLTLSSYAGETAYIHGNGEDTYTVKILNSDHIVLSGIVFHDNQKQYSAGVYVENSTSIALTENIFYDHQGFGIVTKNVSDVSIEGNDLYDNANAIEIRYGSAGVVIKNNKIHNNTRKVDSGRGAIGVTFYRTTGPVTAIGNQLWDNHSTGEADPEGAAFEVYAGGNVSMIGNTIWENETVLETGTDGQAACSNITFTRNVVYRIARQQGLILRCASNSMIANNTFDGLDEFVFYLTHFDGEYGGSIEGLKILNNVAVNGRVYSIESTLPASVEINHNLVYNPGSSSIRGEYLAYVKGKGNTKDLSEFQDWTGYDLLSVSLLPMFSDAASRNYHLLFTSPAIDIGKNIGEPFIGLAPDAGAFEYSP